MLKISHVNKSFAGQKVISDLNFSIKKGEIVGLLGPNGAGKTTTMRMIASFFYPDSGEIIIDGENTFTHTLSTQQKIGYMPENNPLYLEMLAFDFLDVTLSLQQPKLSEKQRLAMIKKLASKVHLQDKLGKTIGELSKGYRQRVGIVAALLGDPQLLIFDEPTEGLDPNEREEIRSLIKSLGQNRAVLISSHVLQEIKAVCDRVIILNEGKVVADGDPHKLTKDFTYSLQVEGEKVKEELEKMVKSLGGSLAIKDGKARVKQITLSAPKEIRPTLSAVITKHKWTIWELTALDQLEAVFKEIK